MTVEQAYKIAVETLGENYVDYCVEVNGGWVILGKQILQPLYITDEAVRGLSLSIRPDAAIIRLAEDKLEIGDFY